MNENVADSKEYLKRRKSVEKAFEEKELRLDTREETSPCEKYKIIISYLDNGKGYWDYVKGDILNLETGENLFTILRNYGTWFSQWIEHQNGNDYLLCGEDYQGYVCLNLTEKKKHVYFPEHGLKGWGFCWIDVQEYDKSFEESIWVEGCYWGAPFEKVEYDFTSPDELPYKELNRCDLDYEDEDDWDDEDDEEDEE